MILIILLLLVQLQSPAETCTWGRAREVGALDTRINESSGMAISRRIANRTYRINDSGDTGRFFVLDFEGAVTKIVQIDGFNPADTEDMSIGPCGDSGDCIFIGDIGDNARRRQTVELIVIQERADFPSEIQAAHRVRLRYPDGPHDAEGLAVHPDGTVYITTKDTMKSQIYRLKREQWRNPQNPIEVLELVVTLDWSEFRPNTLSFTRMVTGMSIAPDGKRFLLLNYGDAMEFFVDLSAANQDPGNWKQGLDYRTIALTTLEQEETISYLPDGRSLLYDTEKAPNNARAARIMRMDCR